MSQETLAKFTKAVRQDPALLARLQLEKIHEINEAANATTFLSNLVQQGKAAGFEFTRKKAWLGSRHYPWKGAEATGSSPRTISMQWPGEAACPSARWRSARLLQEI